VGCLANKLRSEANFDVALRAAKTVGCGEPPAKKLDELIISMS
jgi:hypothetical protein